MGRCRDTGRCTNAALNCHNESDFVHDVSCTVAQDLSSTAKGGVVNTIPVTYGSCDDGKCVWSPFDCDSVDAYKSNDPKCTADQVEIGACYKDGSLTCAVSLETCLQQQYPQQQQNSTEPSNTTGITNATTTIEDTHAPPLYWSHQEVQARAGIRCVLSSSETIYSTWNPPREPLPNYQARVEENPLNSDIWLTVLLVTAIVTIAVMMGALICFLFVKSTKPHKSSDYYNDSDDPWTSNHQTLDNSSIPLEVVCSTTEIDHTQSVSEYDAESEVPEESSVVEHSSLMLSAQLPLDASVEHSSLMLPVQLPSDA